MTQNNSLSHQPGFYWKLLSSSASPEEKIPPIADWQVASWLRIAHACVTRKTRIVVIRACEAMLRLKHPALGPEHLLLGIFSTPDQVLSPLLEQHGFDSIHLRATFEAGLSLGSMPQPEAIVATNACKQAMLFAEEEAFHINQPQIGLEHLLLGISRDNSEIPGAFLQSKGLTYQQLRSWLPS
jgi:ATP-dependent Clp protease ATP-binding subunit ClpC